MLRTLSLLLLIVTVGYSQWRDSSRVLVPAPSGKAVKATQFAIGDTNTWKVSGAIAYMGGNFYIANGTYYVLMAGSGSSSADTATFVTKNTTQVVSGTKYWTNPQYFKNDYHDTIFFNTNGFHLQEYSIAGFKYLELRKNHNGGTVFTVRNDSNGTGASSISEVQSKSSIDWFGLQISSFPQNYDTTTLGGDVAGNNMIATFGDPDVGGGNLLISQRMAGRDIKFYTGGKTNPATEKLRIVSNGDVVNYVGDFTALQGYMDADSLRFNGTTIGTKLGYHGGLGASFWGAMTTGELTINGNLSSTGTISTTGTGAHTFAASGSGFTIFRDGGAASLQLNTYGNTNGSFYYSNTFAGTRAAPTQIGASQVLGNFMGSGYINGASRDMAKMQYLAKSTPSATNYSSYGRFQFVPDSSTTLTTHSILDWTNLTTPRLTLGTTAGTGRGNLYIDSLYFGTTLAIDANRKHTNVGGIATTGAHGVAPIVDTVTYAGVASSISAKSLTATAGMYRITYNLFTTTAGTGGTVTLTLTYNNGAAQTITSAAVSLTSTSAGSGGVASEAIIYTVASGTPQVSTTVSGATGSPVYRLDAIVERLK